MENNLEEKNIIEGNKIIAEFMGIIIGDDLRGKGYTNKGIPDWAFMSYDFDTLKIGGYCYHKSFDWLMPVVEKIAFEYCAFRMTIGNVRTVASFDKLKGKQCQESAIQTTWLVVVQFIQWLNSNTKQ